MTETAVPGAMFCDTANGLKQHQGAVKARLSRGEPGVARLRFSGTSAQTGRTSAHLALNPAIQ
jgi:hypothetical protein